MYLLLHVQYTLLSEHIYFTARSRMTTRQQQCEIHALGERPCEKLTLTVYLKGRWDFRPFVKPTFVLVAARKRCNKLRGERRWDNCAFFTGCEERRWDHSAFVILLLCWSWCISFWLHDFVNLDLNSVHNKFFIICQWKYANYSPCCLTNNVDVLLNVADYNRINNNLQVV